MLDHRKVECIPKDLSRCEILSRCPTSLSHKGDNKKYMKKLTKQYQVWTSDSGSWNLTEVDTLEEALTMQKYSDYYITKKVDLCIKEVSLNN